MVSLGFGLGDIALRGRFTHIHITMATAGTMHTYKRKHKCPIGLCSLDDEIHT